MGVVDDLHRAREAYERREWVSAYRTLSDLDESDLTAADFAALATTAYDVGSRPPPPPSPTSTSGRPPTDRQRHSG